MRCESDLICRTNAILVLLVAGMLSLALVVLGCDHVRDDSRPLLRVTLENQSDHSGILIRSDSISGLVSESDGVFDLTGIRDGQHEVEALYPFFGIKEVSFAIVDGELAESVELVLPQLVQFSIVPAETTAVIGNDGFVIGFAENLTERKLQYSSSRIGRNRAMRKIDGEWEGEDCLQCEQMERGVLGSPQILEIPAFSTVQAGVFDLGYGLCHFTCYTPGDYEIFIGFVDTGTFAEYYILEPWEGTEVPLEVRLELNASLLRKTELFMPGRTRYIQ